jgi:flagellar hook-length control protein FliK
VPVVPVVIQGNSDVKSQAPAAEPTIVTSGATAQPPVDATLAPDRAATKASTSDPKATPAQTDEELSAALQSVPSDDEPGAIPLPAAAEASSAQPIAKNDASAAPSAVPVQLASAINADAVAQSSQTSVVAAAPHAAKGAVHAQGSTKGASQGGAVKTRTAAAVDSSGAVAQSDEGDGLEQQTVQTVGSASNATDSSVAGTSSTSGGGADPTQPAALFANLAAPDAAPDNQSPAGAALQGVHAATPEAGGANAAASAQGFQAMVSELLDKHSVTKADAPGAGATDAGGALQAMSQPGAGNALDTPSAVPTFKLGASVDSSEFGQGVANQVSMMVDSNITSAKLQVSPPALGPIEVRIALQGDHASVQFTSHSAVTREALADSTPKLRDMLTSQGFGQVSVDISHRSFQERPSSAQAYEWGGKSDTAKSAPAAAIASAPASRVSRSSVDAYA